MQSENYGNTIVRILNKSKKIYLVLDDERQIEVNEDVVAEFLLYNGKKLSEQEIQKINQNYLLSKCFAYTYGLLSVRSYTENEIVTKLKKRMYSQDYIEKVIAKTKSLKLIDDKLYTQEYIDCAKNKGYGPLRIRKELRLKGVEAAIVEELINSTIQRASIDKGLINKLLKQFSNSNYKKKRQQIYETLIRRGFASDVIAEVLDKHVIYDQENEKRLLVKDYEKIRDICLKKSTREQVFKQLVSKLMQKGYNYHDIMALKEENDD